MANAPETFSRDDLERALRALVSTLGKCEKGLPRLKAVSQRTLLTRRVDALRG